MHLEKLQKVYKLKSDAATTTSTTQCETFLYEDRLVYGINCPVTVTDSVNSEIVCNGVIVCPRLHGEHQKQQQVSSYDVQILHGNGDITVEFGVAAEYCPRILQDVLQNERFNLDDNFKYSMEVLVYFSSWCTVVSMLCTHTFQILNVGNFARNT